jgi:hypothetical protein
MSFFNKVILLINNTLVVFDLLIIITCNWIHNMDGPPKDYKCQSKPRPQIWESKEETVQLQCKYLFKQQCLQKQLIPTTPK